MMTPIKITGMAKRGEEDSINASFDSIENIIKNWKPKVTEQPYDILAYSGTLEKGQKLFTKRKPLETIPIFATRGATNIYVGDLEMSGVFISKWESEKDEKTGVPEKLTIYQIFPARESGK